MAHLYLLPLFILVGALANRHRGGWWSAPVPAGTNGRTQLARLSFAGILSALFALGSFDPLAAALCVPLLWLGCLAGQGYDQGDNTIMKFLGLMVSGMFNIAGVVLVSYWVHLGHPIETGWKLLPYAGLLVWPAVILGKPLVYRIGKYLPALPYIPLPFVPRAQWPNYGFARGNTEWGEVLFGAVEGAAIFAACALI